MAKKQYSTVKESIYVTEHAIKRFEERQKGKLTRKETIERIINQVRDSKLIGLSNNEEHRTHKGYIYVCKRERNYSGDRLVVVTLKLSGVRKREKIHGFNILEEVS